MRFKVVVEMEAWGKDGKAVIDGDLWGEGIVEVPDGFDPDPEGEDEARDDAVMDAVDAMDWGRRRPTGYVKILQVAP